MKDQENSKADDLAGEALARATGAASPSSSGEQEGADCAPELAQKTPSEGAGDDHQPQPEEEVESAESPAEAEPAESPEDFQSKYLYLAAELENQKKRFQRERENLFKFGGEKILSDLLKVIDNLERIIAAIEQDQDKKIQNISTGVKMVKKEFLDTLGRHGLSPLESLGQEFDPNLHEAIGEKESTQETNRVIEVFEQGYKLNGRLLRAAKVIVAK